MFIWTAIALLSIKIQSVYCQYTATLAKSNACFNAKTSDSTMFNAPRDGGIMGVKLVYDSGRVTCWNVRPDEIQWTKWGCIGSDDGTFYVNLIHVLDVETGFGESYYPMMNTEGFSLSNNNPSEFTESCEQNVGNGTGNVSACGYHSYYLDGQGVNDTEIMWLQPSYHVDSDDMFMLQYSEAYSGYGDIDNEGETCADVYFLYYDEILIDENVCFDAENPDTSTIFNAPFDGTLIGVKLEYITGQVTCWNVRPDEIVWNNWGCVGGDGSSFYVSLIKVLDAQTRIGEAYYPKTSTDGFSLPSNYPNDYTSTCQQTCGYHSYNLDDQQVNDTEMLLLQPSYDITMDDMFMLQYSEACCDYGVIDNQGTTCAKVYFLYSQYDTMSPTPAQDEPTQEPTSTGGETGNQKESKANCKSFIFVSILIIYVIFNLV